MKKNSISIIIPTWNEEGNIKTLVERINMAMKRTSITYEIIFVDDYSTDHTREIIQELSKKFHIRLLMKNGVKGKAQSLLEGFAAAQYELICMIDADLQYPPEAIPEMIMKIN